MEVLIVAPSFFPERGVGTFRMTTLADYLAAQGEKVTVVRNSKYSILKGTSLYKSLLCIQEVPIKEDNNFWETCKRYKDGIIKICKEKKVNIIIYTCGPYYAMKIAPEIIKLTYIPYIIDIRDFWLKDEEEFWWIRIIQRCLYPLKMYYQIRAFKYAEKIVVVSEKMKERYIKLYKFKNKFHVIFNGYDDQKIGGNELEDHIIKKLETFDGIKIGVSGVMCQYSRSYTVMLLKALDNIYKKGCKIKLFHIGSKEREMETLFLKYNLDKNIYEELGYLENNQCVQVLSYMNINAIICSHSVGFGTKVFDYIYVKKPILYVGKTDTELAEFVNHNVCSNTEDIVKAILNIKSNKAEVRILENCFIRSQQNRNYYKLISTCYKQNKV